MTTNRTTAFDILEELRMYSVPDDSILDYIIGCNLSAHAALQLMRDTRDEFLPELGDDDD